MSDTVHYCRDCGANLTGDEPHRDTCRHFYDAQDDHEAELEAQRRLDEDAELEAQRKLADDGPSDRFSDAWSGGFAENH